MVVDWPSRRPCMSMVPLSHEDAAGERAPGVGREVKGCGPRAAAPEALSTAARMKEEQVHRGFREDFLEEVASAPPWRQDTV